MKCTTCKELLVSGVNWYRSYELKHMNICITCNKKAYTARRRLLGMKPRPSNWGNTYSVPYKLPDGHINPKYREAMRRARGVKPRKPIGQNKHGVPSKLPNGNRNPEYERRRRRSKGVSPNPPNWGNTYGVPLKLPNGKINPEWQRRQRRKNGIRTRSEYRNDLEKKRKYAVPAYLPNGKHNPEWIRRQWNVNKIIWGQNNKIRERANRRIVLVYYSGTDPPQCADIYGIHKKEGHPFDIYEGLNIDHMNDNGKADRRNSGRGSGKGLCIYLINNSFPDGYQILCANCNWFKELLRRQMNLSNDPKVMAARQQHVKTKNRVFEYYSKGTMACADTYHIHEMPFTDVQCLTIDHINGGGAKHRKRCGIGGNMPEWLYHKFLATGRWPNGFQVLCRACQDIKRIRRHEVT